jgi:MFS superfamily sulfate permease-like transporter
MAIISKRKARYYRLLWLRHDLPAGIAVFLIALPLCLGISLASGAPLYAGILSGIIGGLVVSLTSGSPLAVSGPAAGLTTVVSSAIISFGDYKIFLLSVIVAGIFQVLLGLLRLGMIAYYFPSAVIKGMLAAIGIILISKQVPIALGYDKPDFWSSGLWTMFSSKNVTGGLQNLNVHLARGTIIIALVSLAALVLVQTSRSKILKLLPAPLLAVILGILVNLVLKQSISPYTLKPTQLVNIPSNIFQDLQFADVSKLFSSATIWRTGVIIGLLASLESLLCVEAIDKLDKENRITPANRELIAQGTGNVLCGLLGGIPLTAVIVRGAANVDAGARSKLSSFTHGLLLLVSVLFFPFALNQIPYASLAAILLITGYNLTKPKLYKNMWSLGLKQFLPFIFTIVVILSTDLLFGVSVGLLISMYFIIQNNLRAEYKIQKSTSHGMEVYYIRLNTNVTFLNKVKLRQALDNIPSYSVLTIDGSACNFIEYDILEIISEFEQKARNKHIELHLAGIERVNVSAIH